MALRSDCLAALDDGLSADGVRDGRKVQLFASDWRAQCVLKRLLADAEALLAFIEGSDLHGAAVPRGPSHVDPLELNDITVISRSLVCLVASRLVDVGEALLSLVLLIHCVDWRVIFQIVLPAHERRGPLYVIQVHLRQG